MKTIKYFFILVYMVCVSNAVNLPLEEKRGLKRHWQEYLEAQVPPQPETLDLFEAINSNNVNRVILLLNEGVNVNQIDDNGNTPLIIAAEEGREEIINHLLGAPGIDVNRPGDQGITALMGAVENEKGAVVTRLLQVPDIEIDAQDSNGDSALLIGVTGHFSNTVAQLVWKDADVNLSNPVTGVTPLMDAAFKGYEDIVQILLKTGRAEINKQNQNGITALLLAVRGGHPATVLSLLKAGANANSVTAMGITPLSEAENSLKPDKDEIVKLLKAFGAKNE